MSAITSTKLFGSFSAAVVIFSAHAAARSRSILPAAIRTATRRKFSINAKRSMMGMAHNSPNLSVLTV